MVNYMNLKRDKNDIIISDFSCFTLADTFDCGQCFRWNAISENEYIGVAYGKVLKIAKEENSFRFFNTTLSDFEKIWKSYFDFDRDYLKIQKILSADKVLEDAIKSGGGIRLLMQDTFETIISFIISSNNNIPRIKLIIERFCSLFGEKIISPFGEFYSFPTIDTLKNIRLCDLAPIKAGFRDKYIIDAIEKISSGEVCLDALATMDYDGAKKELLKIKGIGEKVANCILLFGLGKYNAFPIDVWVKRVMSHYYFNDGEPTCDLAEFADSKFGNYSGFAQQYLFYHARLTKLK